MFSLTDPTRPVDYATSYTITSPEPVLVEFEGSQWRLFSVLITDRNRSVWANFRRQTATGRDVKRGGFMSWRPVKIRAELSTSLAVQLEQALAGVR